MSSFTFPYGNFWPQRVTDWPYYPVITQAPDLSDPPPCYEKHWSLPTIVFPTLPEKQMIIQEKSEPFSVKYGSVCMDNTTGQIMVYDGKKWIHIKREEVQVEPETSSLP